MPDFLLEIGCEEIPARMIDAASLELRERVAKLLQREHLSPAGTVSSLDSPRRLAVLAAGIPMAQPDVTEQVNWPSDESGFQGWKAYSCGGCIRPQGWSRGFSATENYDSQGRIPDGGDHKEGSIGG